MHWRILESISVSPERVRGKDKKVSPTHSLYTAAPSPQENRGEDVPDVFERRGGCT